MSDLRWFGLLVICVGLVGCPGNGETDDDDDDDLPAIDCEWFAGDNCWKDTVTAAAACAAPEGETGVFDAAFEVCTFTDGTEVHFAEPPPVEGSPNEGDTQSYFWDFEIAAGGSTCMSMVESDLSWEFETSIGTFLYEFESLTTHITCPDGEQGSISGFAMLECEFGDLPQFAWTHASSVSFDLGGGADGSVRLFTCAP